MCADMPSRFHSYGVVVSRLQKAVISMFGQRARLRDVTTSRHTQLIGCVCLLTVLERQAEGLNRPGLAYDDNDWELKIDSVGRWQSGSYLGIFTRSLLCVIAFHFTISTYMLRTFHPMFHCICMYVDVSENHYAFLCLFLKPNITERHPVYMALTYWLILT